jgi:hypothetical protein
MPTQMFDWDIDWGLMICVCFVCMCVCVCASVVQENVHFCFLTVEQQDVLKWDKPHEKSFYKELTNGFTRLSGSSKWEVG